MNTQQTIRRMRQGGLTILLAGLLLLVSFALLYQGVLAGNRGKGANGCGGFQDAVASAGPGDSLLIMPIIFFEEDNDQNTVLSKSLIIEGGWDQPNIGCDPGPFDTTTETINIGGYFYNPFSYGRINIGPASVADFGLIISPSLTSTLSLRQVDIDNQTNVGITIGGVIANGAQVRLENMIFDEGSSALDLEVRDGSSLVISDSLIINHGAVPNQGFGGFRVRVFDTGQVVIHNTRVSGNLARTLRTDGGGGLIEVHDSGQVTVSQSTFVGNQADGNGGSLTIIGDPSGRVSIINSLFAENTAGGNGAELHINGPTVNILHTTIAGPTLNPKQGIYIEAGTVNLHNTIIASHSVGLQRAGGTVSEDYNLYFSNTTPRTGAITSGGHSLDGADPVFGNPAAEDYRLVSATSAALDRGANLGVVVDFEGESRPLGLAPDIGYDERGLSKAGPATVGKNSPLNYTISLAQAGRPRLITTSITNAGNIAIPDLGNATPYPSTLNVTGLTGVLTKATVTLYNLTHADVEDLSVLLVGPTGQKISLMSDAGDFNFGNDPVNDVTLTFDDTAQDPLPSFGQISSGIYQPGDYYFNLSNPNFFNNAGVINIPATGQATPYPSTINISGLFGVIERVEVGLEGLNHARPDDLDILLVGPGGQKVVLMSDAGDSVNPNGNLAFAQYFVGSDILEPLPDEAAIVGFSNYLPTNYGPSDSFPASAPGGPYSDSLSVFNGTNPNGTWSLYVVDDMAGTSGNIDFGWYVRLHTRPLSAPAPIPPYSDQLAAFNGLDPNGTWSLYAVDDTTAAAGNIAGGWTLNLTTLTPDETITVTDTLPPGVTFKGASGSGWACNESSGLVTCNRSDSVTLAPAPPLILKLTAPQTLGFITNTVVISSSLPGLPGNTAFMTTEVVTPTLFLPIVFKN